MVLSIILSILMTSSFVALVLYCRMIKPQIIGITNIPKIAAKMVPRKLSGMKARLFANIFIFTYSSYSKGSKTVSGKRPLPYIPFFHLFYHFAAKLQSCDLHFGLSLQCADHDALYKVLLQKRINTQNRKCCHDNNRIFDTLRNAVRFCNAGILRHV